MHKDQRPRQRSLRTRIVRAALLLLAGVTVGAVASHFIPAHTHDHEIASELGTPVRPGPWGELYTVPFTIAAPDEQLPVYAIESGGTHWLFKNFTVSELSNLLESTDLQPEQRAALLDPAVAHAGTAGIELTPPADMVVALPPMARQAIYRQLAQFPENRTALYFIHKSTLNDRFKDSGVAEDTLSLFHSLCCEHGEYLVFSGLPAMLAQLRDAEEKLHFLKALTRQKTMLIRLRVTHRSELAGLVSYWGKGDWTPTVRAIIESVERVPGGSFMSVLPLLPPMPAGEAYFYPLVPKNSAAGPAPIRDCHWTSLNFFRETPDSDSSHPDYFAREIAANYYPITSDPRYGDVLVMAKPDGEIVHSAVFIADEIVFTKNGSTAIYPWMFSTVTDLVKQYSFQAPEGQHLTLTYFRNKSL
jgi:hypothetical protein